MSRLRTKKGLDLKKRLVSNLATGDVLGGAVRSTIGAPTCRLSQFSECATNQTQTYCNVCDSWLC